MSQWLLRHCKKCGEFTNHEVINFGFINISNCVKCAGKKLKPCQHDYAPLGDLIRECKKCQKIVIT